MKLKEKIMILICSFTGSIITIYMTLFLLNFVGNPMDLSERVRDQEEIKLKFVPLLLAIPLSIFGIFIQFKI